MRTRKKEKKKGVESIASPDNNNDVISRRMNLKHVVKCCQIVIFSMLDLHGDLNLKNHFWKDLILKLWLLKSGKKCISLFQIGEKLFWVHICGRPKFIKFESLLQISNWCNFKFAIFLKRLYRFGALYIHGINTIKVFLEMGFEIENSILKLWKVMVPQETFWPHKRSNDTVLHYFMFCLIYGRLGSKVEPA